MVKFPASGSNKQQATSNKQQITNNNSQITNHQSLAFPIKSTNNCNRAQPILQEGRTRQGKTKRSEGR
jgi:hypothetical protein